MRLTDAQQDRYSRHLLLDELGGEGQERLLSACVRVRGSSRAARWAARYLAASGVGTLILDDASAAAECRALSPDALDRGLVGPGKPRTLIDSTSGNTGIAYAWLGAALGVRVALVMPENVSEARKQLTRAYGAEQIFSDPLEQSDGAIRLCRELVAEEPGRWFYADQYANPW